ncbi:MAG: CotH kinase family protein [Myxococcales bacterium]|nr:CotH kinase family protein [Myxococcales bacterium]
MFLIFGLAHATGCSRTDAPPASVPQEDVRPKPEKGAPHVLPRQSTPVQLAVKHARRHALFQLHKVTTITIELNADARAALRHEPRKYTRGTVRVGDKSLTDVGVRLKGHRSFRTLGERPSFILDFTRFAPKRRVFGLRKLVLNAMVEDPTFVRETLGYQLFRRAGVPAPRTGYAALRVNGAGAQLYLLVEPVDKFFLKRGYKSAKGNLYEGEYGCDLHADDVWGFDLDAGKDTSRSDLKALVARMPGGVTVVFGDGPGAMDRDRTLAFLAMSVVVGDFDGYEHHHNYYLYHQPKKDRWALMPWGLDRIFFQALTPFSSEGLLARMCFRDLSCRLAYIKKLQGAVALLDAADLPGQVSAIDALIGDTIAGERPSPHVVSKRKAKRLELLQFVAQRRHKLSKWTGCLRGGVELDRDQDGYGCMDCDDRDPKVHPGATETCDGVDNDCSGLADDAPSCPCTVKEDDEVRFELCDLPMPWLQAAKFCEAKGMRLARIDSKTQSKLLYRAARRIRKTRWWIGLNDRKEEDRFVWRGEGQATFTYWKSGEPSNIACGEDCAVLAKRGKGRWIDSHCGLHRAFICRAVAPAETLRRQRSKGVSPSTR